jgi:predicted acylesterase/phospholipase RssA
MEQTALSRRLREPGPKRLLALDGGGIRGLVTLGYLAEIEKLLRRRSGRDDLVLSDYFDLIGGTSTGAIIASLLAMGYPVSKILELYRAVGHDAFQPQKYWLGALGRLLKARFQEAPLEKLLRQFMGDRTLASEDLRSGLMIVAKRADTGSVWSLVNIPDQKFYAMNKDLPLWQVVRSSTAAPTYFNPQFIPDVGEGEAAVFVDGGVSMHNNPALQLLMVATLEGYGLKWPLGEKDILLCSVGTGSFFKVPRREELRGYNNLQWAGLLISQLMNDASELNQTILQWLSSSPNAQAIDMQIGNLAGDRPGAATLLHYLRYDIPLLKQSLSEVGLDYVEKRVRELWEMSDVRNVEDLEKVGLAAAAKQVREEHFPAGFDRVAATTGHDRAGGASPSPTARS